MTTLSREQDLVTALERHLPAFVALRHHLHGFPETAYEEVRTANIVAEELASAGLEVHRLAGTGVVGVLRGPGTRAVALRADLDALNVTEETGLPYASRVPGKMHACGHDGHTTALLLAARVLAEAGDLPGTMVFVFQPAEEGGAGAKALLDAGLLDRFPVEAVYGLHNIPGLHAEQFAVLDGPVMASADGFEVVLRGVGGHAALPHEARDPVVAAGALIGTLQTLVSRSLSPLSPGVVSVTQLSAGEALNVIPDEVKVRGTVRAYTEEVRDLLEAGLRRVSAGVAQAHGVEARVTYTRSYPATVNDPREAAFVRGVLQGAFGEAGVRADLPPLMAAEDFAFLLRERPGAYVWIGNGNSAPLHSPRYDFNDGVLPRAATFWVHLARAALTRGETP
ncbi:M20 aminoacylase family protein [Deinococcus hopiensis]|uniref:Hippurate hydrolase n=1 Tax=Deinococcus hopiensis KR-140 TaxID=695939 RepID=A0A1W1UR56_9DEIO|nr:M20 aminoacylase family protein [Deinococcus hopiensis]SMB83291.1 hippurate hydrolase [Deinococcus hopiensis KR-140]